MLRQRVEGQLLVVEAYIKAHEQEPAEEVTPHPGQLLHLVEQAPVA